MTREQINALTTRSLKSIVASTNPTGRYAQEVYWAKQELERRGVDYSDCLEAGR